MLLTTSEKQSPLVALEFKPLFEEEAKKRQSTSGKGLYGGKPLRALMSEREKGQSRDKAAEEETSYIIISLLSSN
jgi:hypothetical protein